MNGEPVLICPHAQNDINSTSFVCRTSDGLMAACSESCEALESGVGLSLVHRSHIEDRLGHTTGQLSIAVNSCLRRSGTDWSLEYFEDSTVPEPGEFRLAGEMHEIRQLDDNEVERAYETDEQTLGVATLEEGFSVIPAWREEESIPETFTIQLAGNEKLVYLGLDDLGKRARNQGVMVLALDFLTKPFDLGLLVSERTGSDWNSPFFGFV